MATEMKRATGRGWRPPPWLVATAASLLGSAIAPQRTLADNCTGLGDCLNTAGDGSLLLGLLVGSIGVGYAFASSQGFFGSGGSGDGGSGEAGAAPESDYPEGTNFADAPDAAAPGGAPAAGGPDQAHDDGADESSDDGTPPGEAPMPEMRGPHGDPDSSLFPDGEPPAPGEAPMPEIGRAHV